MTIEDVINELTWLKGYPASNIRVWSAYTIMAFNTSIDVLNKQLPKKPIKTNLTVRCPVCNRRLSAKEYKSTVYCSRCGQRIDWSKNED